MWKRKSNLSNETGTTAVLENPGFGIDSEQSESVSFEELRGKIEAIDRSQATIEFALDGTILAANKNFLDAVGFSLDEIRGKHHRMFVEASYANSKAYSQFWEALQRGEPQVAQVKRIGKGNREIWLQASYNPIYENGKLIKIVKYATDTTEQTIINADYKGQIDAAKRSLAVIEFNMDGIILTANDNFLNAVGYRLDEIKGEHHSLFIDSEERKSSQYKVFWESLNRGEFQAAEFRRIGKNNSEVWLQASYNPVLNHEGKPVKVVKFASDITQRVDMRNKTKAVGQEVASSVTQMVDTIDEISRNVQLTAGLAKTTEEETKSAETEIESLTACSQSISSVVDLIRDLAEQTNLLALNATIEAARAGEAGRGFAVVASEVKELAKQTSGATKDISDSVERILSCIKAVVSSTHQIEGGVSKVSENTTVVAAAIEEQSTTMASLGRTASQLLELTAAESR